MPVVAAFVMPPLPHLVLKPDVAPWQRLGMAATAAGEALAACRPDTIAIYSTQWIAVLDQLWQTRPRLQGVHVDENWYEWGDLAFDISIDVTFAEACITRANQTGLRSKSVNYDGFPIDTGTIVAMHFVDPGHRRRAIVAANNIYHDWVKTEQIGRLVRAVAQDQNKRVAAVAVGGLSARMFRSPIDPAEDRFAEAADDEANRRVLAAFETGDAERVRLEAGAAARAVPMDSGLKHLAFLIGALGERFGPATVHGYEPIYGTGGVVVDVRARGGE
jgi:2-aminophenol/2-amino-5-chlorophenol 1,6-dioxygenase alpha subunit